MTQGKLFWAGPGTEYMFNKGELLWFFSKLKHTNVPWSHIHDLPLLSNLHNPADSAEDCGCPIFVDWRPMTHMQSRLLKLLEILKVIWYKITWFNNKIHGSLSNLGLHTSRDRPCHLNKTFFKRVLITRMFLLKRSLC